MQTNVFNVLKMNQLQFKLARKNFLCATKFRQRKLKAFLLDLLISNFYVSSVQNRIRRLAISHYRTTLLRKAFSTFVINTHKQIGLSRMSRTIVHKRHSKLLQMSWIALRHYVRVKKSDKLLLQIANDHHRETVLKRTLGALKARASFVRSELTFKISVFSSKVLQRRQKTSWTMLRQAVGIQRRENGKKEHRIAISFKERFFALFKKTCDKRVSYRRPEAAPLVFKIAACMFSMRELSSSFVMRKMILSQPFKALKMSSMKTASYKNAIIKKRLKQVFALFRVNCLYSHEAKQKLRILEERYHKNLKQQFFRSWNGFYSKATQLAESIKFHESLLVPRFFSLWSRRQSLSNKLNRFANTLQRIMKSNLFSQIKGYSQSVRAETIAEFNKRRLLSHIRTSFFQWKQFVIGALERRAMLFQKAKKHRDRSLLKKGGQLISILQTKIDTSDRLKSIRIRHQRNVKKSAWMKMTDLFESIRLERTKLALSERYFRANQCRKVLNALVAFRKQKIFVQKKKEEVFKTIVNRKKAKWFRQMAVRFSQKLGIEKLNGTIDKIKVNFKMRRFFAYLIRLKDAESHFQILRRRIYYQGLITRLRSLGQKKAQRDKLRNDFVALRSQKIIARCWLQLKDCLREVTTKKRLAEQFFRGIAVNKLKSIFHFLAKRARLKIAVNRKKNEFSCRLQKNVFLEWNSSVLRKKELEKRKVQFSQTKIKRYQNSIMHLWHKRAKILIAGKILSKSRNDKLLKKSIEQWISTLYLLEDYRTVTVKYPNFSQRATADPRTAILISKSKTRMTKIMAKAFQSWLLSCRLRSKINAIKSSIVPGQTARLVRASFECWIDQAKRRINHYKMTVQFEEKITSVIEKKKNSDIQSAIESLKASMRQSIITERQLDISKAHFKYKVVSKLFAQWKRLHGLVPKIRELTTACERVNHDKSHFGWAMSKLHKISTRLKLASNIAFVVSKSMLRNNHQIMRSFMKGIHKSWKDSQLKIISIKRNKLQRILRSSFKSLCAYSAQKQVKKSSLQILNRLNGHRVIKDVFDVWRNVFLMTVNQQFIRCQRNLDLLAEAKRRRIFHEWLVRVKSTKNKLSSFIGKVG